MLRPIIHDDVTNDEGRTMTILTDTFPRSANPSGRAGSLGRAILRRLAGNVAVAFATIREATVGVQLLPAEDLAVSRWAGARA